MSLLPIFLLLLAAPVNDCRASSNPFLAKTLAAQDQTDNIGLVMRSAKLWIGFPEEENAMPFLLIPEGTKVKILNEDRQYYKVNHKNVIGYVAKEAVQTVADRSGHQLAEEFTARGIPERFIKPGKRYEITQATSLRTAPDSRAKVLLRFPVGAEIKVLDASRKYWWRVVYKDKAGWAKCALIKELKN